MANVPGRTRGALQQRARHSLLDRKLLLPAQAFIHAQQPASALLLLAAVGALLWANSPWSAAYFRLWETRITLDLGGMVLAEPLGRWINDGLMTLFFF